MRIVGLKIDEVYKVCVRRLTTLEFGSRYYSWYELLGFNVGRELPKKAKYMPKRQNITAQKQVHLIFIRSDVLLESAK